MSQPGNFEIDLGTNFPHLPHAPIVEAVIHWQAAPTNTPDREELRKELELRFEGYTINVQQTVEAAFSTSSEGVETQHATRWGGFRLTSTDRKYVCQITPNAVVFSRLAPYEHWPPFVDEGLRFWETFVEITVPITVERLAVRFISQIELKEGDRASDFVKETQDLVESIGLLPDTFFRQDTMVVPNYPYRVNLVRAIQGVQPPIVPRRSLIVDIDVFTTESTSVHNAAIEQRLKEMRFLKNFVFFNFIKDAEKRFGAPNR